MKMQCNKNYHFFIIIYISIIILFSCSSVKREDKVKKELAVNNNTKVSLHTLSAVNPPSNESDSDCVFEKKYISENLSEDIQNLGRTATGLWKSENVESLTYFPKDKLGYYPDWVAAVEKSIIDPRGTLDPEVPEEKEYQPDTLLIVKSPLRNNVCFPHSVHTYWLRCNNCHPEIFIAKKNANPINMTKIIKGEFCGRCHGKVAFHVANNCHRCHNTPK